MHRSVRSHVLSAAIVVVAGVLLAACTAAERPALGPPTLGLTEVRGLGAAPIRGAQTVRFSFATVTGIPGQMRFDLEKALQRYAATRNLTIAIEDDPAATYRIRGFLSAVGDQNGTLLVYTWDVHDSAGRPLHRIAGQQTAAGSSTDPWAGVGSKQIDDAARETIDKLADWIR
jgi:hypothetical protein